MEFTAKEVNGKIIIDPIIVKDGGNVTVHVPSFRLIEELKQKLGKPSQPKLKVVKANNGKRRI